MFVLEGFNVLIVKGNFKQFYLEKSVIDSISMLGCCSMVAKILWGLQKMKKASLESVGECFWNYITDVMTKSVFVGDVLSATQRKHPARWGLKNSNLNLKGLQYVMFLLQQCQVILQLIVINVTQMRMFVNFIKE